MAATVLLIGESGVGKTHYGAQLLGRLHHESGRLRMRGAATNIRAFESALHRLSEGRAADHTPTTDYLESEWPITDGDGNMLTLVWPDYGGEQVRQILEHRRVPEMWRDRVVASAAWMLFVRVQHTEIKADLFSRPIPELKGSGGEPPSTKFQHSDQARLIELLQMLLFLRGADLRAPLATPALAVLLSCWDELVPSLGDSVPPRAALSRRLPLLTDFVTANWQPGALSVLGLSALGRPLRQDAQDQDYLNRGPEHFGYVVQEDGTVDNDLTLPIVELVTRISGP